MKLYLINQNVNRGYDTFDSAVVAALNEEEARKTCPSEYYVAGPDGSWCFTYTSGRMGSPEKCISWAPWTEVKVAYLGDTILPAGVICASFNAG